MIGLKITLLKRFNLFLIFLIFYISCGKKESRVEKPVISETSYTVKKGQTIEAILNNELSYDTIHQIIKVLKNAGFPFRKCMPGDIMTINKYNHRFSKLVYEKNIMVKYHLVADSNTFLVSMKYPYVDTVATIMKGAVNSTLYESMLKYGETANLVYRFADIFAWEVDFVTDTRNGDSFFVYFEKTFCDSQFIDYQNMLAARYKGEIGDFYGIFYRDPEGDEDYYNLKGESLRKSLLKSPLRFSYISSYFTEKRYHPILKVWRPHHGLDYVAPKGTPVSAIGDGVVTFKGWKGGYGRLIEIRHKNNFKTRYGHLSGFAKGLHKGKRVKMGQLIGYVGATGLATGPHLHFELHKNGVSINPLKVKIPRAPSVKKKYLNDYVKHCDSLVVYLKTIGQNKKEEKLIN